MSRFEKKKDLPFSLSNDFIIVEYVRYGKLYLVKNPNNIDLTYGDYIAVTRTYENEEDKEIQMPYAVCRVVGFTNKLFEQIALELLYFDVINLEYHYHGETVIKNLTNDENKGNGAQVASEEGASSASQGLGSDKKGQEQEQEQKDGKDPQEGPQEQEKKNGKGVNDSDDVWGKIPFKQKTDEKPQIEIGTIFSFIKKTH